MGPIETFLALGDNRGIVKFKLTLQKFLFFLLKFLENRAHQQSLGGKYVPATIKAGFYPEFAYPNALLRQIFARNQGGAKIAYLNDYFFMEFSPFIGIESRIG